MDNPFVYDRPLPPEAMIDREPELRQLVDLGRSGQSTRLTAPRRYGKTTLLNAVGKRLGDEGMIVVNADFSRVRTLPDVTLRLHAAWREALDRRGTRTLWRRTDKRLSAFIEGGVPGVLKAGVKVSARTRQPGPLEALHELLALPDEVYRRAQRRVFVIFDEFPELLTARDDLDGIVRSHAQHQARSASYCYSGSQPSMMRTLFEDRRRPLFGQARSVGLGPLPGDALAGWLRERFGGRKISPRAVDALVETAAGHPQRAMMIAHFLWEQPLPEAHGFEAAVHAAVHEAAGEIQQVWLGLTPPQRRALATAAGGHAHLLGPTALAVADSSKATMQKARRTLLEHGHLRAEGGGAVSPSDPFMGLWLAGVER